ncbi:MAG: type II toxin-antitoxin system VapC family toxin [Candidatus Methylacidiphilaceae bacterium]
MIVLDTNVVSEAMKAEPNPAVRAWLDDQVAETLYLSSITLAELLFGIGALPSGRRKDALTQMLDGLLELFEDRVLTFDTDAARHYAELAVAARAAGKGFSAPDGYIAAIANSRGFTVATRDIAPFQAAGLNVINPWETIR